MTASFPSATRRLAAASQSSSRRSRLSTKAPRAFGEDGRQRAPAQLLQEYLNAEDKALWGLVSDGRTLRLYRDNAAMTRPAYIEADLSMLFDSEAPRLADFSALWLLTHASRFGNPGTPPSDSALERWREEGRAKGARAREELRGGVEQALTLLGQGFLAHPANAKLNDELAKGTLSPQGYLDALLRLVYRLIFVFAAEDRDLLHSAAAAGSAGIRSLAGGTGSTGAASALLVCANCRRSDTPTTAISTAGKAQKILFRELWHGQPDYALLPSAVYSRLSGKLSERARSLFLLRAPSSPPQISGLRARHMLFLQHHRARIWDP